MVDGQTKWSRNKLLKVSAEFYRPSNIQRNNCEYNKDSLSAKLCDITDIATKCGLGPPWFGWLVS